MSKEEELETTGKPKPSTTPTKIKSYIDKKVDADAWYEFVPIVSNGKEHTVYINEGIEGAEEYSKLTHFLRMLPKDHTVTLELNTPGGSIDSGFAIVNAIQACKAKTIARIQGTVASAGTIITMACDDIEVGDYSSFMIHNYFHGAVGTGNKVKTYVDFTEKSLNSAFSSIYKGFLTKAEMKTVTGSDKEMWMMKDEVLKRWANKKKAA